MPDQHGGATPEVVDRNAFTRELDALRIREKAHTHEGDAIAAARRRLPMVEVDATQQLLGPAGPLTLLDAFEGRSQLVAYYFMWNAGRPAAEQCEGCTYFTSQIPPLSYVHSRDITYAVFSQGRNVSNTGGDPQASYDASLRYRDFLGWTMPWYSAQPSLPTLLGDRQPGLFHLICYLRDGERVYETYWTTGRGVEAMDSSYGVMDLTPFGRRESWEDSPPGYPQDRPNGRSLAGEPDWPQAGEWPGGRPMAQWARLEQGAGDDLHGPAT